jgi:hypothetical protein
MGWASTLGAAVTSEPGGGVISSARENEQAERVRRKKRGMRVRRINFMDNQM